MLCTTLVSTLPCEVFAYPSSVKPRKEVTDKGQVSDGSHINNVI